MTAMGQRNMTGVSIISLLARITVGLSMTGRDNTVNAKPVVNDLLIRYSRYRTYLNIFLFHNKFTT